MLPYDDRPSGVRSVLVLVVAMAVTLAGGTAQGVTTDWNLNASGNWPTGPWTAGTPTGVDDVARFLSNTSVTAGRTITQDQAFLTVGTLYFNDFGWTIASGSGGAIKMQVNSGSAAITVDAAGTAAATINPTINLASNLIVTNNTPSANLLQNGNLTLAGGITGTGNVAFATTQTPGGSVSNWALAGTSTVAGNYTIDGGRLLLTSAGAIGANWTNITLRNGGVLNIQQNSLAPVATGKSIVVGTGGGTLEAQWANNAQGGWTLGGTGAISGSGNLTFGRDGDWTISGSNTGYTGSAVNFYGSKGTVTLSAASALGNGSVAQTFNFYKTGGAIIASAANAIGNNAADTLNLYNSSAINAQATNALGSAGTAAKINFAGGSLGSSTGTPTLPNPWTGTALNFSGFNGSFTMSANHTILANEVYNVGGAGNTPTVTFSGVLSGAQDLVKHGAGTMVLGNTNSFGGLGKSLVVHGGALDFAADGALGTTGTGITLDNNRTDGLTTLRMTAGSAVNVARLVTVGSAANTVVAFDASNSTGTFGFAVGGNGITGGSASALLRVNSTGIVDLSDNNVSTPVLGSWRLDSGTLKVGNIQSSLGDWANQIYLNGGTLQQMAIGAAGIASERTIHALLANVTGSTTGGTLNVAGGSDSLGLDIANQLTGLGGFTKSGPGTLAISKAQNFGGYQTVSVTGGTLKVDADNRLGAATNSLSVNTATLQFDGTMSTARNLSLAGATTLDTGYNVTLSGIISNTGTLTKTGSGVLTLSGINTYTGNTTLSATSFGTLQAGSSTPAGATTGPFGQGGVVTVNANPTLDLNNQNVTVGNIAGNPGGTISLGSGTLTVLGNAAQTFAGRITGSGGLTKLGPNDLTLTGDNTFTGTLLVQNPGAGNGVALAGTFASGKLSGTTNIVINSGAALKVGTESNSVNNSISRLNPGVNITLGGTGGDVALAGASLTMGTRNTALTTAINSVTVGTGNNTIGQSGAGTGTQILQIAAATPIVRNVGGTLNVASSGVSGNLVVGLTNPPALANGILGGWLFFNSADFAMLNGSNQIVTYTGYQTGTLPSGWAAANNVSVNAALTGNIGTQTINSLRMNNSAAATTATINSTATLTIATGGILNNNVTSTITGGSITSGTGDLILYTGTSGGQLTVSSKITGNIGLTRTGGAGTVVIGGSDNNDYTGTTYSAGAALTLDKTSGKVAIPGDLQISAGTVTLSSSGQIAPASNVSIRGGTLALASTGAITLNSLALIQNGNVSSTGGPLITLAGQNAAGNALTLGATNTYNGTLTVAQNFAITGTSGGGIRFNGLFGAATVSGTLDLGSPGTPFLRTVNVDDGIAGTDLTLSGAISGNNGIEKTGPGRLDFATTNSFTGGIKISGGILHAASDGQLGGTSNSIVLNGGTFRVGGAIGLTSGRKITVNNTAGNTLDTGGGTLTLNTANQLTGSGPLTVVGGGSLTIGAASSGYTGALSIGNAANFNGTLILGAAAALPNVASISVNNGGTLRNDFSGAQVIGAPVFFGGNTTLNTNNGTFTFNGPLTFTDGTMSLAGNNGFTANAAVTGSGSIASNQRGTLVFATANPGFSGNIYILGGDNNSGTVQANVAGALGTGTVTLGRVTAGGGTLRLGGAAGFTLANNISILAQGIDTARSTISAPRIGPGLGNDNSGGVYTIAGNVTGNGGLVIASSTGSTPGEIAFTGNLAWTGASGLAQDSGGQYIAGGPGSIGTQTAFVRFVDPAKLPSGGANNQVSYHMAMANGNSGGADDFAGFIFQTHAAPYTFANAAAGSNPAYKFAVGGLNGGGGPMRGVLGAAGTGAATLAADALIVTDGSLAMGLTLLARDSTFFKLGTPGQAMRFVPATGSVDAANTALNASASSFVDAAGTRQLIKRGTGTVVLSNVGYTNVAGSGNTIGQFSWQIGRGSNPATATTFQFDGAVRETGVGTADSTASLPVYLRGGTLEIDGNVYASSSVFNRPIHSSTGSPATAGQIDLGGNVSVTGSVDPTWTGAGDALFSDGGGGFSAYNADAYVKLVNVGGGFKIGWSNGTVPAGDGAFRDGAPLILGSRTANATLVLQNDLDLGAYASGRTIATVAGASATSPEGRIAGIVSGTSATTPLFIVGDGRLDLGAANTYAGQTIVAGGTLLVSDSVAGGSNGPLGNPAVAQRTILLGNTSGTSNAALLTNGAYNIGRDVTVEAGSSGTATLGGNADASSTFSGAIAMNRPLTVAQVATSGTNALSITGGITTNDNALTFTGAGDIEVTTALSTSGNLTKSGGGTLTTVDIVSNAQFTVSDGPALVGALSGTGTTTVHSSLTANSIVQNTLTIAAGGSVTIRATPAAAGSAHAVPEPGTIALLLTAVGGGLFLFRRR